MGNTSSSANHYSHGDISVAVERGQYMAGEVVRGYVNFDVTGRLKASDLSLKFDGMTKTVVHYTRTHSSGSGSNHTTTTTHHWARQQETLVSQQAVLATYPDGDIPLGLQQFPFELAIPRDVPSSCVIKHGRSSAAILYTITVQLRRPGFASYDMVQRVPVDVIAMPPQMDYERFVEDKQQVDCCCCCNRGSMTLMARLPAGTYAQGDPVNLNYKVANESKSDVQKVSAKVQVTVSFSAHGHHTRYTDTLQKELLLDSTPAKDGSEKIPAIARSNTLNPVRETPTSYAQFNLRAHGESMPSVENRLVNVNYLVAVVANTGRCITDPEVQIPIYVKKTSPNLSFYVDQVAPTFYEGNPNQVPFMLPVAYNPPEVWGMPSTSTGDAYVPGVVGMPVQWSTVPYDSTGDGVPDMGFEGQPPSAPPPPQGMAPPMGMAPPQGFQQGLAPPPQERPSGPYSPYSATQQGVSHPMTQPPTQQGMPPAQGHGAPYPPYDSLPRI